MGFISDGSGATKTAYTDFFPFFKKNVNKLARNGVLLYDSIDILKLKYIIMQIVIDAGMFNLTNQIKTLAKYLPKLVEIQIKYQADLRFLHLENKIQIDPLEVADIIHLVSKQCYYGQEQIIPVLMEIPQQYTEALNDAL